MPAAEAVEGHISHPPARTATIATADGWSGRLFACPTLIPSPAGPSSNMKAARVVVAISCLGLLTSVPCCRSSDPSATSALGLTALPDAVVCDGHWTHALHVRSGVSFRLIKPGRFTMGTRSHNEESPPHVVTISRPYYISDTPVTVSQWRVFHVASRYLTLTERAPLAEETLAADRWAWTERTARPCT